MKHIKRFGYAFAIAIALWSIITDITTYNVFFPAEKGIILYCVDGLLFNWQKILVPLLIGVYADLTERTIYASRTNRCR